MNTRKPETNRDEILILQDDNLNSNNVCIVTGAGGGIGRATAIAAAANGLMTVGLDINAKEGKKTQKMARDMNGQMIFIKTDLAVDKEIEHAIAECAKMGSIKYLANISEIQDIQPNKGIITEQYDNIQRIMLRAPLYLSELAIPYMKKNSDGTGVIGNMASIHVHIRTISKPVFNITKSGLRALSRSISAEGKGKIRAFTVCPGFAQNMLMFDNPVNVANLFIFGFSHYSRYITSGDILFDGGIV
ncbi:MAG: SDR family NAD(P)-dependent oxidoreductase [Desulfobacteraceae bacterium]|nr:SDR family NAD(P)-dependent oxidoreductase [Desulfobacteraceae bacterium]